MWELVLHLLTVTRVIMLHIFHLFAFLAFSRFLVKNEFKKLLRLKPFTPAHFAVAHRKYIFFLEFIS